MSEVPAFVKPTVDAFTGLVEKPSIEVMTRLFKRPPVKFIHDLVTNTLASTGFPQGLFPKEILEVSKFSDRSVKVWFINKLISVTSRAAGRKLAVRAEKVVAGKEVEQTNEFLQEFARAARNAQSLDVAGLVQQTNAEFGLTPDGPTQQNPSEEEAKRQAEAQRADQQRQRENRRREAQQQETRQPPEQQQQPLPQQRRPSDPAPQANQPAAQPEEELSSVEWIAGTQAALGPLIQKPKLSERLLSKPPFRFLHDVVMNTLQAGNIGQGLYNEHLSNSKAIKGKEDKIEFLRLIIQFLSVALNTTIDTEPRKVVAGKDPESTNVLLQELARAVRMGVDTQAVLQRMRNPEPTQPADPYQHVVPGTKTHPLQVRQKVPDNQPAPQPPRRDETPMESLHPVEAQRHQERPKSPKPNVPVIPIQKIQKPTMSAEEKLYAPAEQKKTSKPKRPRTARPAPPSVKDKHIQEAPQDDVPNTESTTTGIIMESEEVEEEEDSEKEEEEEAGGVPPLQGFAGGEDTKLDPQAQGKLVRDILKTQKQAGIKLQRVPSSRNSSASKWYSREQIEELRSQIQRLCQSVNPLGKCMDFVSDDVQQMTRELDFWKKSYEQECKRLAKEQRRTDEQLAPHYERLAKLEAELMSTQREIHSVKATIMRNEDQVRKLVDLTNNDSY